MSGIAVIIALAPLLYSQTNTADQRVDTVQTAKDDATIKRILKNWGAREQRIKSIKVAWTSHFIAPAYTRAVVRAKNGALLNKAIGHDFEFDIPQASFWLQGKDFRYEFQQPKWDGFDFNLKPRCRTTYDGQVAATLEIAERENEASKATIWKFDNTHFGAGTDYLRPLRLAIHPASSVGTRNEAFRVVTENAILLNDKDESVRCVRIEKGSNKIDFTAVCWVDPARDDILIRWEICPGKPATQKAIMWAEIDYQKGKEELWVPAGWKTNLTGLPTPSAATITTTVDKYSIDEKFPAATFAPEFPPGTVVIK